MDDIDELLAGTIRAALLPVDGPGSRSHQLEMMPAHCRSARALLDWTKPKLAEAARLGLSTVVDFERNRRIVSAEAVQAIRRALESAGVEFIAENGGGAGVRLRKGGPTGDPAASILVEDLTAENDQ
jgi:hypothetical protein